ncbi:MAG: FAD-dependent oxidoreductase [Proteobacteria bacterium]|nr:FAD-dependent oxidoreductase [Pseudomonadota bacterium]
MNENEITARIAAAGQGSDERDKALNLVYDDLLRIGLHGPDGAAYILPGVVIIAAGAYEQPPLFPGSTLPGVMTTGAAQTLLRSYGLAPGKRVLVAGNGPLNLQVATELAAAGARVVGVVDRAAAPWQRPGAALRMGFAAPDLGLKGLATLARLRQRGIPVLWRSALVRADGEDVVSQAIVCDAAGRERTFDVDAICVNEGFSPSNELARLLGCEHRLVRNGWSVLETVRDAAGATSQPDVFVIGEAGGFGGAHIAMAQGALCAAAVLKALGRTAPETGGAARALRYHRRFQTALWQAFRPATGAPEQPAGTIICRCEGVAGDRIAEARARTRLADIATIKRLTRAGMGKCQGRYCAARLAAVLDGKTEDAAFSAPQMPLRPIPLAALAVEKPEWGGHRRALLPPARLTANTEPLGVDHADVLVIGAGVVGASTALFLARAGVDVVVLERDYPNSRASGGNAGSLHAQLLSFDHGAKAESGGGPAARTLPLQRDSIALWQVLQQELGADFEIKVTGGLMVAENDSQLRFLDEKARLERSHGIDCEVIGAEDLRAMEPALNGIFAGAAYCPQEGKINPLVATQGLIDAARARGVRFLSQTNVTAITDAGARFIVETSRGRITARRIVNAAGAFASEVGAMAGVKVPVFGAPLQMIVTETAAPTISRLIAHADRHLTLKQAANGNFLIGGGWTAGLDPVHRHPRALMASLEGNLWVAQHVVPALRQLNIIRSWGAMNINIDGAPILGEAPRRPRFFNAVTSNGYTLGPLVGRATADLVLGGKAGFDVAPFSLTRFDT